MGLRALGRRLLSGGRLSVGKRPGGELAGGLAGSRAAAFGWRGLAAGKRLSEGGAARRGAGGGFASPRRRLLSGGGLSVGKRPGEGGAAPAGSWQWGCGLSGGGFWLAEGFRPGNGPARAGELVIWCPCADSRRVGAERAAPRRRAEAVRSGHCGRGLRGAGRGGRGVRALPSRWGTAAFAIQAKGRPRRRKDRSVFKVRVWGEKIPFTQPAESGGLLQKNATLPGISQKEYRKFTVYS